jgi:hypothetical protein
MAAPKKAPTSLAKWDEQLAKIAQGTKEMEQSAASTGNFIGTKGGQLTFQGAAVQGNVMDIIIVEHVLENAYYKGEYDPDSPQPPVCFALGRNDAEMKPHEKSAEPQNATCKGCPHNEWGSADRGRGKACKNTRRLALIPESDLKDPVAALTAYLKLPVTSVKAFAGYVKNLVETMNRPPFAVVTTLKAEPDPKNQFKILTTLKSRITDPDVFEGLIEKHQLEREAIMFPYTPPAEFEAPVDNKKKKFAKGKR